MARWPCICASCRQRLEEDERHRRDAKQGGLSQEPWWTDAHVEDVG